MLKHLAKLAILCATVIGSYPSFAESGFGPNFGLGIPFSTQVGLNLNFSDYFGLDLSYNRGNSHVDCTGFDLRVSLAGFNYHPWGSAFYIGLGGGYETLRIDNIEPIADIPFTMEAEASLAYAKLGWMWGRSDGGFWFGIDFSGFQSLGSKKEINATGVNTDTREYRSSTDKVKLFAESNFLNITFARLGYLF